MATMDDQLQVQDLSGRPGNPAHVPFSDKKLKNAPFPVCNKNRYTTSMYVYVMETAATAAPPWPYMVHDALSPGSKFDDGIPIQ